MSPVRDVDVGSAGPVRVVLANSPHGMRIALVGDKPVKMLTGEQIETLIPLLQEALEKWRKWCGN